jgi:hypothetical protein
MAAQPPLKWVASVKILMQELPKLNELVDWHAGFLESCSKILLWEVVGSRVGLTEFVGRGRVG